MLFTFQDETSPRPASGMSTARTEVPDEEAAVDDEQDAELPGPSYKKKT